MKRLTLGGAVILSFALVFTPAEAAAQGHGQGQAKKAEKAQAKHKADKPKHGEDGDVFDRDGHVRVIHDYQREGLPPGLAKRQSLPPGLEKQLHERGELPPGLQKRWVGVPGNLAARMPPMAPYYHRYFAGNDLLVVDSRTNTIAYLIKNVLQ